MKTIFRNINFLLAPILFVSLAHAQGKGLVEGKLINGTDSSIIGSGVDLDVISFAGGMGVLKSAVTDSAGKFRIDGLPTDSPLMIRANYKSVNYHGQVQFGASDKATVDIEIFEPTASMNGIRLEQLRMAYQFIGGRLQSIESYTFRNETKPPKTFMSPEGNFRFSKAPGLLEPPRIQVTGPGSAMPLTQSPLESPDGKSYYDLYPIRPGVTTFEVQQLLPYSERTYTLNKKFYYDANSVEVGVIPQDLQLSGAGLNKVQTDAQRNFAIYSANNVKAGTDAVWTFSGGTPVVEPPPGGEGGEPPAESKVKPMPGQIAQNALIIGPLLLIGLISVLWYGFSYMQTASVQRQDPRMRELRDRREQLLNYLAGLDRRFENQTLEKREYVKQREQGKRQLRRIAMLLKK